MANILFKRGTQAALNTIIENKTAVDGTFYLTTDSKRLYVGTADKVAVPVNEGVNKVADMATLNAKTAYGSVAYGDFYYVMDKNILAIYGEDGWTQINPDTDIHVTGVDVAVSVEAGVATLTTSLTNNKGGTISDLSPVKIKGKGGITLDTAADGALEIGVEIPDAIEYNLSAASTADAAKIVLTPSLGNASEVEFEEGANVTIAADGNKISIAAKDTTYDNLKLENKAQGFGVSLIEAGGKTLGNVIDPTISFDKHVVHFANGNADLNDGLTEYINKLIGEELKDANAMTYRGALEAAGTLPTSGVKLGDTYLVNIATYTLPDGQVAKQGDLLIASGGAEKDGVITSDLAWTIVESGDEIDTTYSAVANAASKNIVINASTGGAMTSLKVDQKDAANPVKVSMTTDAKSQTASWTVEHAEIDAGEEVEEKTISGSTGEFKLSALTGVSVDDYGHITGFESTSFTVNSLRANLHDAGTGISAAEATGGASLTMKVALEQGGSAYTTDSSSVKIVGDTDSSVTVGVENNEVVIGLAWGTF